MDRLFDRLRRSSLSSPRPPKSPPRRLYITSNTPDFDRVVLRRFCAEGFTVEYLPFLTETDDTERDRKDLESLIHEREDDLEPGERYAIVAYNRPAYLLLLSHHQPPTSNPFPLLCAFVAFYPHPPWNESSSSSRLLPPSTTSSSTSSSYESLFSPLLPIQIHLAATQNQSLWDNYSDHPSRKRHRCHLFFYPESQPGFAESNAAVYDSISFRLAWSRALDCLKRGFGWPAAGWRTAEPEVVWEMYWKAIFESSRDPGKRTKGLMEDYADRMLDMMVGGGAGDFESNDTAGVNCVSNAVGGSTPSKIAAFYASQFLPSGPPSQHIRLLSRTAGADRVVDELLLSFEHTEEIPWLLPGVPPTGRSVRIPLVMTASFCAGKIARHNIYWDQASVLVQIGLLDPALIPAGFRATGPNLEGKDHVERIPVVGGEAIDSVLGDGPLIA